MLDTTNNPSPTFLMALMVREPATIRHVDVFGTAVNLLARYCKALAHIASTERPSAAKVTLARVQDARALAEAAAHYKAMGEDWTEDIAYTARAMRDCLVGKNARRN